MYSTFKFNGVLKLLYYDVNNHLQVFQLYTVKLSYIVSISMNI